MGIDASDVVVCLFSAVIVALGSPATASASDVPSSHCTQNEDTIFSCHIKDKIVSVCSSKDLTRSDGYLQYRFGKREAVELQYPRKKEGSTRHFYLEHYFRANVDRWELSFANNDVHYTVFSYFEGEERPSLHQGGVTISGGKSSGNSKSLYCTTRYTDHFDKLENVVQVAPDSR